MTGGTNLSFVKSEAATDQIVLPRSHWEKEDVKNIYKIRTYHKNIPYAI